MALSSLQGRHPRSFHWPNFSQACMVLLKDSSLTRRFSNISFMESRGHLPLSASLTSTQGWGAGDGIWLQRHLGQCGKCPHSRHPFAAFGESCKTRSSKKNIPCVQSLWQIEHIQCPLPVFCRSTNITNCCVLKAAWSKCVKLHSQKQLESAWPTIFGGIHCGGITCTITPYP